MIFKLLHLVLVLVVLFSQLNRSLPCGVPRPPRNQLIVNGRDTIPGQWPWHAALYHRKHFSDKYLCGGTLIGEWYVLSAAHCTLNPDNNYQLPTVEFFIRLGVHNLNRLNRVSLQEHGVDKIFKADGFNSEALRDDLALLRLSTKADFDQYVQPACLNREPNLVGQYGTAVGWGLTEHNSLAAILRSARMPVIEDVVCLASDRDTFGSALHEGIFCAGYTTGTAVCNGDSGGGLFFQHRGVWYLGGVVSFSTAREEDERLCNSKGYGAFTKVSKYVPWLSGIMGTGPTANYDEYVYRHLGEQPGFSYDTTSRRPLQSSITVRPQTQGANDMIQRPGTTNEISQNIPQLWDDRDGNDSFVQHQWSSHRVDEDPQTGEVIRKESRYNVTFNRRTETDQSQADNIDASSYGPLISTILRETAQRNGDRHVLDVLSRHDISDLLSHRGNTFNSGHRDFFNSEPSSSHGFISANSFDRDGWK